MSLVDSKVDLGALARRQDAIEPPKRGWLRIVVPLAIVAAFAFVLRDALVELFRPRPEVTLARPIPLEGAPARAGAEPAAGGTQAPRRVAVQAAGWIEPDPYPVHAPALDGGIVREVLVQESDAVAAGTPVARLVDDDARLAVRRASAELATREAALALASVRADIAAERFTAALEVTEARDRAAAMLEGARAEARHRAESVAEGVAKVDLAESEVIVQRELDAAGASGARQVEIAEAEVEVARARLEVLRADAARAAARVEELVAGDDRARRDVELRFADRLARDESAAEVERARAEVERARVDLADAELRLARTIVVAPRDSIVLERIATEGDSLAVGAAVCSLYDPEELRVRVDVPQGDIEGIYVGQRAEILADVRAGRPYAGEVIRIVQRADIQKVTLEAQVRVFDADGLLKPDMLTQVRFFAPSGADGAPRGSLASGGGPRIALARALVRDGVVWVFDPVEVFAERRTIELGEPATLEDGTEVVEVVAGLDLTDKVIDGGRAAVEAAAGDGDRVPVRVRTEGLAQGAKTGDER